MSEWVPTRLGEVTCRVQNLETVTSGAEYPLLGVKWYAEGPFLREVVTTATSKATRFYCVEPGQFIYNRLFAWKGAFGLIGDDLAGSYVSNEFPLFDCDLTRLLPEFLNLHFGQRSVWSYVERVSTGTTASRSRWKESQFRDYELMLPPTAEQRRIVDVVTKVDTQIEALADEVRRAGSLYSAFLADFSRAHPHRAIRSVVLTAQAGGTPSRNRPEFYGGEIPWLKSGEVDNDAIETAKEFITELGLIRSSAKIVPPGATVVAMYGQGDTKGRAGFVRKPVATNQAVLALVPDESKILARLLLHAVRSQTEALRARAIGAAQPNLSKGLVASHEIPVPDDLDFQQVIADAADTLTRERAALASELSRLRAFRSSLVTSLLGREIQIRESYDSLHEGVS